MNFKDAMEVGATVITGLGGGGAIVFGLSNYLGKIWADRGLEKQKQEYSQLNIAFQNQLDIATRRLQVDLDALGLIHKLRTQEEFTRLSGLWIQIVSLRNQYAACAAQFGWGRFVSLLRNVSGWRPHGSRCVAPKKAEEIAGFSPCGMPFAEFTRNSALFRSSPERGFTAQDATRHFVTSSVPSTKPKP